MIKKVRAWVGLVDRGQGLNVDITEEADTRAKILAVFPSKKDAGYECVKSCTITYHVRGKAEMNLDDLRWAVEFYKDYEPLKGNVKFESLLSLARSVLSTEWPEPFEIKEGDNIQKAHDMGVNYGIEICLAAHIREIAELEKRLISVDDILELLKTFTTIGWEKDSKGLIASIVLDARDDVCCAKDLAEAIHAAQIKKWKGERNEH
jgi:hypothetical protein